ncbi:MAG: HEAT repeat domain-containing protein [Verrucomicrobia bacterium]|nr:HEAT repeat domain-containing protein [Verrucomicrobiota bacterium]
MLRLLIPWKIPMLCALTSVGVAFTLLLVLHRSSLAAAAVAAHGAPPAAKPAVGASTESVEISLGDGLGRRWLEAQYRGNGRDEILASLVNKFSHPLRVTFNAGLVFNSVAEGRAAQVVLARDTDVVLAPGESRSARLATVAARLSNVVGGGVQPFLLDTEPEHALPVLDALFARVRACPETSREALQTAVLLVLENPMLGAFAKFDVLAGGAPKGLPSAEAFRVNTGEILGALTLLKNAGYPRGSFAVAREPQLKIEAMIDPLAHAAALAYYGIAPEKEWAYWREELTNGDASTRHYALYGIGRNYPEVALQMLPAWARDKRLAPLYRQSAIQALAETRRPEAISVLQQLVVELGGTTELGMSARRAIGYLENRRNGLPDNAAAVGLEFKLSQSETR